MQNIDIEMSPERYGKRTPESGSWIFMELDEELLFRTPTEERWDRCIASIGVPSEMIWMQPVNE